MHAFNAKHGLNEQTPKQQKFSNTDANFLHAFEQRRNLQFFQNERELLNIHCKIELNFQLALLLILIQKEQKINDLGFVEVLTGIL